MLATFRREMEFYEAGISITLNLAIEASVLRGEKAHHCQI